MHQVSHCPSFALGTRSLTLVAAISLREIRSVLASQALSGQAQPSLAPQPPRLAFMQQQLSLRQGPWPLARLQNVASKLKLISFDLSSLLPRSVTGLKIANHSRYYQVNEGDYCQLIALNFTITVSLFEAINPQINAGCSNLSPGLYYCVLPTADWNQTTTTTTSSYQTAPAPTPSGTTGNCYEVRR
jgi:hypothetical protein